MNLERDAERLRFTEPGLVDAYMKIAPVFAQTFPGSSLTIPANGGYRDLEAQNDAHLDGASDYDGRNSFSKHQAFPARALDWLVIEKDMVVSDGADPRYAWVGHQFEQSGFKWGGTFIRKKDWDHAEIYGHDPSRTMVLAGLSLHADALLAEKQA